MTEQPNAGTINLQADFTNELNNELVVDKILIGAGAAKYAPY